MVKPPTCRETIPRPEREKQLVRGIVGTLPSGFPVSQRRKMKETFAQNTR